MKVTPPEQDLPAAVGVYPQLPAKNEKKAASAPLSVPTINYPDQTGIEQTISSATLVG